MFHTDSVTLTDAERIDEIIFQSISAADSYLQMNQEEIDAIVGHMARVVRSHHLQLARMMVEETEAGIIEDKSCQIVNASHFLEQRLRDIVSVGTLYESNVDGCQIVLEPLGIVAAFPSPALSVATVILQAILSVKSRNPIVFCFPPSVSKSSQAVGKLLSDAAIEAGAPTQAIQWLPQDCENAESVLLQNPEVNCILVDGGSSFLSSDQLPDIPVLGTGIMNTPCLVDRTADIEQAATELVASRYFDNGLMPMAEQTVIISREVYFQTLDLMMQKNCYLVKEQEKEQLEQLLFDSGTGMPNSECTGRDAAHIAEMAGFSVPPETKLILVEISGIGTLYPLSRPKDTPVLSVLVCESSYEGLCFCEALLEFSTSSHIAVLYARNQDLMEEFTEKIRVNHALINRPASRGDIGEFSVSSYANLTNAANRQTGNPTTAPLCLETLLSRKVVQKSKIRKREWRVPEKVLYSPDSVLYLQSLDKMDRTLIVTEKELVDSVSMDTILSCLQGREHPVHTEIFCNTSDIADINTIEQGLLCMEQFRPTALLALGNACTMDIAKGMHFLHKKSDDSVLQSFPDFSSGDFPVCHEKSTGRQVSLITIATKLCVGSAMNGSVTLFSESRQQRRTLQSCALIPSVCIVDSSLSYGDSSEEMAYGGMNILSHAFEAYVSPLASDYSDSMAMNAIQLVFKNLIPAVTEKYPTGAVEKLYNASAMAGMASSNAKAGIGLAMSHSLVSCFKLSPDVGANLLLSHILEYNGVEDPTRYNPLMPGSKYIAHERYQEIAASLHLPHKSPEQSVESLVAEIRKIQSELGLSRKIGDLGIDADEYTRKVDVMSEEVFEDHSTATNPRLPRIGEIKTLFGKI
jgi:acetaldehyde dehydrogenase/alcohol dehydrogenase